MHITGDELTALPSVVAAIAIAGGYFGVRSANRNALRLAGEERSSRRKDELDALKRATYAKYDAALSTLVRSTVDATKLSTQTVDKNIRDIATAAPQKRVDALTSLHTLLAELRFIAPDYVSNLAFEAEQAAVELPLTDDTTYLRSLIKLRFAMLADINHRKVPTAVELEKFADRGMPVPGDVPKAARIDLGREIGPHL